MTKIPEPQVRVTRYEVSCFPKDAEDALHFTLAVEYRGRGLWAVLDGPFALDAEGRKDYESIPSEREDEWLALYRFDLDTALEIAKRAAPLMTVNGWSIERVLAAREAPDGA